MKHITTEDALRALEEAVAEKGEDYVYEPVETAARDSITDEPLTACAYIENGKPSCIAGNALVRLGVPIEDMLPFNIGFGVTALVRELNLPIDDAACTVLDVAQEWQDEQAPWGEALERAREVERP